MPPHFVYILESADGRYYVGYTIDLEKRMARHQSGKGSKFVRGFGFGKLLYHETLPTRSAALRREAEIKGWTRGEKERLLRPSGSQ